VIPLLLLSLAVPRDCKPKTESCSFRERMSIRELVLGCGSNLAGHLHNLRNHATSQLPHPSPTTFARPPNTLYGVFGVFLKVLCHAEWVRATILPILAGLSQHSVSSGLCVSGPCLPNVIESIFRPSLLPYDHALLHLASAEDRKSTNPG
jgi:hypothetical protein